MSTFTDSAAVQAQYATAANLNTRISIHDKYSVNKQGFGNWIVAHYPIEPGMRVLELGCGTGGMWRGHDDLVARCGELVLSGLSSGMLESARTNVHGPNVRHSVIDIQSIPYPDDSFDLVIANMMLYHVPDLHRGLSEVRRVLRDGGTFICATYGENGIARYLSCVLSDFGAQDHTNLNFTLQNGEAILRQHFSAVEMDAYPDSLAVTDLGDMVDYVYSLASMAALTNVPRGTVRAALSRRIKNGVLTVPKEYGLFLAI